MHLKQTPIHPLANLYDSEIGEGTKVAAFVEIGGSHIGCRCKIQGHTYIPPGVTIEDDVFIGPHVCFTNCRFPSAAPGFQLEPTRVKSGAVIGAGCQIGPGITIGKDSMIEMGSLVRTDVPDHHLYSGTPRDFTLRRWYQSQEDVGLPMTFDEWRDRYNELSYTEQLTFYDAVYEKFPTQQVCRKEETARFFASIPEGASVLEIGGGIGDVAREILDSFPIKYWYNLEISQRAIDDGLNRPQYQAQVPEDFVWNLDDLPICEVLVASHVFEHIRADQIEQLLQRLTSIRHAYVEAPIPESSEAVDWTGRWSTHILEIGWAQLETLFHRLGFQVAHRAPNVRWFKR